MSKIDHVILEKDKMERLANRDQWMNRIHPLVKLFITVLYIAVVVSFEKYHIFGLAGLVIYLILAFNFAELSFRQCLWRLRMILPIVCVVGIANPFLDTQLVDLGGIVVRAGVLSMLTLMLKGVFAVLASYVLIATTAIEEICYALRLLHVPAIMVTQLLLTYRYLSLLLEEVNRLTQAYALRAPKQKGVHVRAWGSLTGQLLLRSIDRANEVYDSMCLRGYRGEFHYIKEKSSMRLADWCYLLGWSAVILLLRYFPIVLFIGRVF